MAQPTYVLDAVFASDALLRTLTEQYGTPLLVYDRETWLARVESLRHAFAWAPRFRQFFPVKAAANPALLRMLLEAGCGLLCGSQAELMFAMQAGECGEALLFTACFPNAQDWEAVQRAGASVILDHPAQLLRRLCRRAAPGTSPERSCWRRRPSGPVWYGSGAATGHGGPGRPAGGGQPGDSCPPKRPVPARRLVQQWGSGIPLSGSGAGGVRASRGLV